MNRIDRLFGILTLLQSKKYVPAEKVAGHFQISVRTVYRDIKALGESGIPVSFEPGKGYFIVQGYFLPPVSFTSEEANALLLMESIASAFSDRSILTHYSTALNKVKNVLRGPQKEKLELLNDKIRLQIPSCFENSFEYLSVIQDAILAKCVLEIGYCNMNNETSKREVEPVGLVFYALNWHLIAWCRMRHEYRDFRVSRIQEIHRTTRPFSKADLMELKDYMASLPVDY